MKAKSRRTSRWSEIHILCRFHYTLLIKYLETKYTEQETRVWPAELAWISDISSTRILLQRQVCDSKICLKFRLQRRKVLLSVKRLNSKTDQLSQFRLSLFSEDKVCINKEDDSDKSGMVYEVYVPVVHHSDTAGQSRPGPWDTVHWLQL